MFLRFSALLIATACFASPTLGAVEEVAGDTTSVTVEDPGDKMVCKGKREARTGSNMRPGKECRKASEWKEREVAAQRELTRLRDKSQTHGAALGR